MVALVLHACHQQLLDHAGKVVDGRVLEDAGEREVDLEPGVQG
jgi:hypothetical protein